MSLQVQSSQPASAPSGRRTPQVYQNLVANASTPSAATSTATSTNGNSSKSSAGKLSLKGSSSGKSSPATSGKSSPAPTQPTVTVTPPTPQAAPAPVVAVTPTPKEVIDLVSDEKEKVTGSPKTEKKEATNGKDTNGKHEEVITVKESPRKDSPKASPKVTPQKSILVEQIKTPETVSPKKPAAKEAKEAAAPEASKKKVDSSLVTEKTLKGFTAEGDEMESLVVEPSEYEDSPMPTRTGGKSKLLKGGPPTRARISPFRVAQEATVAANASTVVNLSTVSEGQHAESNESSPAVDFNRPLRTISGRRSTRPLSEIQFSYRKPAVDLNDSTSSLNVTVGSEIHNDSLRTPAGPCSSRKRKAMTPESTSDALDVKEHTDSPKRTRLDFSGFLGIVASPVTMLKNRFSRVRLHASTPVAKRSFDTEEDLVGKVVTAEATTTTANISGGGATADNKMEVEPAAETGDNTQEQKPEDETTIKEGQTDVPADATSQTETSSAEEAKEDTVEVKDVTDKQRRCVIM